MKEQRWFFVSMLTLGYVLAYIGVWLTRSDCGDTNILACSTEAAFKGAGDLIQFAWVWTNPEIAAGLMTLAAALTVFISLSQQRSWVVQDAAADRRDKSLAAIVNTRSAFQRLFNSLYAMRNSGPNEWPTLKTEVDRSVEHVRAVLPANASVLGANVASSVETIFSDIVDVLRNAPYAVSDSRQIRLATAMTILIGRYLHRPELLLSSDGRIVGGAVCEPDDFADRLNALHISRASLNANLGIPLSDFFLDAD